MVKSGPLKPNLGNNLHFHSSQNRVTGTRFTHLCKITKSKTNKNAKTKHMKKNGALIIGLQASKVSDLWEMEKLRWAWRLPHPTA